MGLKSATDPMRRFRPDIEGLRAYAVLLVVLDHLHLWPHGGFIGVDVFFVISGFLITGLVAGEIATTGRFSIRDFYVRRARRILPAAVVVLLVTVVTARLVVDQVRSAQTLTDAWWALGFAANIHLTIEGTSYFQSYEPPSLVQHYWSLAVEEQFYVVWPLLLLGLTMLAKRVGSRGSRRVVLPVLAVAVVASFVWCVHQTGTNPNSAYFSTLGRAWELGLGALVALAVREGLAVRVRLAGPLSLAGLLGIVASAEVLDTTSRFPGPGASVPVVCAALVLLAGVGATHMGRWQAPLTNPVARYVGRVSFSLYLVHWPAILLVGVLVPATAWVQRPLTLVVIAISTLLCHYLVERPFHRFRSISSVQAGVALRRGVRSAPAFVTVWLVVCSALLWTARPSAPEPPQLDTSASGHTVGPAGTALQSALRTAIAARSWPQLRPSFSTVFQRTGNGYGIEACDTTTAPLAPADDCTVGSPDAPKRAVIVGDSTSEAYIPTFREIVKQVPSWQVRYIGMAGCNFVDLDRGGADVGNVSPNCVARTKIAAAWLRRTEPDLIVYTGGFLPVARTMDSTGTSLTSAQYLAGWRTYIRSFDPRPGQLLLMAPPPTEKEIHTCFTPSSVPASCLTHPTSAWKDFARGVLDLAREERGRYLDSRQFSCVSDTCPAFVGTTPVKRDLVHLTPEYAKAIAPAVLEQLRSQGLFTD